MGADKVIGKDFDPPWSCCLVYIFLAADIIRFHSGWPATVGALITGRFPNLDDYGKIAGLLYPLRRVDGSLIEYFPTAPLNQPAYPLEVVLREPLPVYFQNDMLGKRCAIYSVQTTCLTDTQLGRRF
jgi:hypothetical protein